ncbi:MAG TPA: RsmE family RNA methyltransferase [Chitinophagales bacterium]|nr:RsmE family RNA methyltransferase [Chitinophagales bacterium]
MNIFYCPDAILNEYVSLPVSEQDHVVKVLRKREGEELFVFDGKGKLFETRIESIGKKEITIHVVRLMEVDEPENPRLHIAIAPPKNMERFEWFAEKACEVGINEITPLICSHSERRELKPERIEKVLISACKQSKHFTLPKINPVTAYDSFIKNTNHTNQRYIAWCDEKSIHLKDAYHGGFDAVIVIGPEGDFTKEEVLLAEQNEFEPVSLGKSRLRLETAAVYATVVFNVANE